MKRFSNQMKVFLRVKTRLAVLEYCLFASMIAAVITVTFVGMGVDLDVLWHFVKTHFSQPAPGDTMVLPISTSAVHNAASISGMTELMAAGWQQVAERDLAAR